MVTAADFRLAEIEKAEYDEVADLLDDRIRVAYNCVREAQRLLQGIECCVTLFSGVPARRPRRGAAMVSRLGRRRRGLRSRCRSRTRPGRVNVVAPGITATRMLDAFADRGATVAEYEAKPPLRRIADPADVAEAVTYLMRNRFTTGTTLRVDGGALMV